MNFGTMDDLLELNGIRYVIDEQLSLWVKFEIKRVIKRVINHMVLNIL